MTTLFKYLKPIIFFGLACFLLWIALRGINFVEFKRTLKTIPLYWVLISMLLGYLAFVFRGLRWALLIKPLGYRPRKFDLVNAIAFGYLFNSFIQKYNGFEGKLDLHTNSPFEFVKLLPASS